MKTAITKYTFSRKQSGVIFSRSSSIANCQQQYQIRNNSEIEFTITFSGKNSPAKISSYKLDLKNLDFTTAKSLNDFIVEIDENKLLSQIQVEKGNNRESLLKLVLGR